MATERTKTRSLVKHAFHSLTYLPFSRGPGLAVTEEGRETALIWVKISSDMYVLMPSDSSRIDLSILGSSICLFEGVVPKFVEHTVLLHLPRHPGTWLFC